ncbi:MAG: T9SS type A sorting domain-containing protein [Chitinophagaceae bacterium]|nr:T9SS type A sorting domain-containing protein [Chitinophagaceae bacterium]
MRILQKLYLTILPAIFAVMAHAQVNIITTIAGKTPYGFSGDGGPATNAQLKAPYRICPDQLGNIHIADALNHRIRSVSASGVIATTVGKGSAGFSGDGGDAISAEIEVPQGVFVDKNNNLLICDGVNNRIRKVDLSTGIISTIVGTGIGGNGGDGGAATSAELNGPVGICTDKDGNIFIADWRNKKVRVVKSLTNEITTFAGTGGGGFSGDGGPANNATIDGPEQVFADTNGNILIADQYNHRIRKVDRVTQIITTIAGNGTAGYSGDGGLAVNAKLNQPTGLFVDKQNNIYVAEYGNGTVRKIDGSTGIITTVAGTGVTGFSGDGGPATNAKLFCSDVFVDSFGNLIIADYENNRIRKVSSGVAVTDIDKAVEAKLFPNPTTCMFSVQVPAGLALLTIYNIGGVAVLSQTITTGTAEVDLSGFPSGIYLVYVRSGDKLYANKVLKQ